MSSLYSNLVNEVQKLLLRKKTVFFMVISVLIPAGAAALFSFFQRELGIFAVGSAGFPVLTLGVFASFLLPLFIFSAAADIFSGEQGEKTLKLTLTRPITRFKVFLSKNIALSFFIVINLALVFVASVISGLFLNGILGAGGLLQALLAYIVTVIPMLFLSITAVFLAQFFKNSGAALATSFLVYLAGKAVPFISSTLVKINPFSYTDWYTMWVGSAVSTGRLLNIFLLILSYSLILSALGFYIFDRKDI